MTEPEDATMTIEKLVGVYRVLIPHKIAAYTYHRNATSEITDMPTVRILDFILRMSSMIGVKVKCSFSQ